MTTTSITTPEDISQLLDLVAELLATVLTNTSTSTRPKNIAACLQSIRETSKAVPLGGG